MNSLVLLSVEEIVEINRSLGYSVLNKGFLDFIESRLRSFKLSGDVARDTAKAAAILWYEVIRNHPFCDGNKRTAAEAALFLIKTNNYKLNMPPNGIIYTSLRVANNDITFGELVKEIHTRLEKA